MQFRYQAVDNRGDRVSDTIEAPSLADATNQLRDASIEVMSIEALATADRIYEPRAARPPTTPRDVDISIFDTPAAWGLMLGGAIFAGIASIFVISGLAAIAAGNNEGIPFALFPLIHLTVGLVLMYIPFRNGSRRKRLYRDGEAIMARIDAIGYDRSVTVNGKSPFEVVWTFDLAGHRYHDKRTTFHPAVNELEVGEPIWVLYDPNDPEESVEWPPVPARRGTSARVTD